MTDFATVEQGKRDERRALNQQHRQDRRARRLHDRLRAIEHAILGAAGPGAARVGRASRGESTAVLPPGADVFEIAHAHPQEIARRFRDITAAIERLEELLDAHRGVAPARDYVAMDSHDKNAAILTDFMGWRPEEIVAFEPALGTARTIRYVRTEWAGEPENHWPGGAVRGVCGHGEGQCTDACPKLRGPQADRNGGT